MKNKWDSLVRNYTNSEIITDKLFDTITEYYSASVRYYHNLIHIELMLNTIELFKTSNKINDFDSICFATWFHDIIYEPGRTDNEEKSAEYALKWLEKLGLKKNIVCKIDYLIRKTKSHFTTDNNEDFDTCIFLDSDLLILGVKNNEYTQYVKSIRKEYKYIDENSYRKGRLALLYSLLSTKHIYRSDYFKNKYETKARENIRNEIQHLQNN